MNALLGSWITWVEVAVVAGTLLLLDPLARRVLAAIQIRRTWRERLLRLLPAVEIAAWSVFAGWTVSLIFAGRDPASLLPVAAVGGVLLVAAWFAVRDVISGAILRTEAVYTQGEWLRVENTEGRISSVGVRSVELETEDGKRLRVPYSRIARGAITKAEPIGAATVHSFEITVPWRRSVADAKARLQRAALLAMWSSTTRAPQVELARHTADDLTFEVTIYALHPDYDLEVENAVRETIGRDS